MLIECMSINSLQLVIRGVIPAIKLYVSLYLHSKCILLNVVLKLSIVINIAILVTAPFVVKTQCLMLLS